MRRGVTLIEVLVACIILAVVVAGFILALLSIQSAVEEARAQAIVAAFCNLKFAELETRDVTYIYQTYGTPQALQVTDGEGNVLIGDTVTFQVLGDDTNGDGEPDRYYDSPDLVCVQAVFHGKVVAERVFGNTDPYAAAQMTPPDILIAAFSAEPQTGLPPLEVTFKDLSTSTKSTIIHWHWDLGDGTVVEFNSSDYTQEFTHEYQNVGTYTVTLTVTDDRDPAHTATATKQIVVTGVRAQFTATPFEGECPLEVSFTDGSTGDIDKWIWDFGDGSEKVEFTTDNYQETLSHTYSSPGVYTVSLTVQRLDDDTGQVADEDTATATITVKMVLDIDCSVVDGSGQPVDVDPPPGDASPEYGHHAYQPGGGNIDASAGVSADGAYYDGDTRYVCLGYKLLRYDPQQGQYVLDKEDTTTTVSIPRDTNYKLTWKWRQEHKLTVNIDDPLGNGEVYKRVGGQLVDTVWFAAGTQVELEAVPKEQFRQWTGDASGTNNQIVVTMNSAKNITAVFNQFKLTITTDPSGISPSVLDPPKGDNWLSGGSKTCMASLHVNISDGARYRLTSYTGTGAAPSGSVSLTTTTDPYQVTFNLNKDSSLAWKWERFYRVTASVSPSGGGSITWNIPAGTQYYTDDGERWFKEGSSISLTATANTHYHFVEWQEDGRTISTGATLNLNNINSARSLVAVFAKDQVTLTVKCKVDGSESSLNLDNPDPGYGDNTFGAGENVDVSVSDADIVNDGTKYVFCGWEGNGSVKIGTRTSGSESSFSFAINMDSTLWWCWKTQYRLHLVVTAGGSVDVTVDSDTTPYAQGTYDLWFDAGKTVTLKATPSGSNQFLGWEGDYPAGQQGNQTISVTLDGAKSLTARFGVQQVWNDYFNDGDNLDSQSNTEVKDGYLQLAQQPSGGWDPQAQMWLSLTHYANVDQSHPAAQTFVPSMTGELTEVKAMLYAGFRWGWPDTDRAFVEIWEANSNGPTGSGPIATSEIVTFLGGWQEVTFTFTSPASVTAGHQYAIVWKTDNSIDAYRLGARQADPYSDGALYLWDSGAWTAYSYYDFLFKVYIEESGGYFPQGDAVTETIGGDNVVGWGNLELSADKPNNTTITVEVYNAETDDLIKSYSVEDGNNTFNLGEDVSETIKKIYLKIVLETGDAGTTPKVDQITLTYYTAGN